jgi:hypothetical protein
MSLDAIVPEFGNRSIVAPQGDAWRAAAIELRAAWSHPAGGTGHVDGAVRRDVHAGIDSVSTPLVRCAARCPTTKTFDISGAHFCLRTFCCIYSPKDQSSDNACRTALTTSAGLTGA